MYVPGRVLLNCDPDKRGLRGHHFPLAGPQVDRVPGLVAPDLTRGDLALAVNNVLWCLVPALFLATYYRQRTKECQHILEFD